MTLLEMVIAITVLAIVILAIAGSVNAGLGLVRKAKVQDIATELANGELEKVSRLRNQSDSHAVGGQFSYENVALVGQTPDGRIEPSSVQTVRGIEFTIRETSTSSSTPYPANRTSRPVTRSCR